jgi:hypothetical protein
LALLCGNGLKLLDEELGSWKPWPLLLGLCLLAGGVQEALAFERSQEHYAERHYGPSQGLAQAAGWLKRESAKQPLRILTNLGSRRRAEFEWLCWDARQAEDGKVFALLSWESLPALGAQGGRLSAFGEGEGSVFLFEPAEPWRSRLLEAEDSLKPLWDSLPRTDRASARRLLAQAAAGNSYNPWALTSLWERRMNEATLYGAVDEALMSELRRAPLLHAGPLYHPASYLLPYHPALAAELHAQALRLDPRLREYEKSGK